MSDTKKTPITTPAPDFDRVAYWAGMAMRGLLDPSHVDASEDKLRSIAKASWAMARLMIEERP